MTVNLQSSFKKDERDLNGLEAAREEMIAQPLERRVVVAIIEVTRITTDIRDGGTQTPTNRLVQVEVMEGDRGITARKLLDETYHERTGQAAPPPTLFDEGGPGQDAATHNGEADEPPVSNSQPWDEREGDDNTDPPAADPGDDAAPKRGRKR